MLVCKSASLSPDGGIKTVWEDSKDLSKKYEIIIPPEIAEVFQRESYCTKFFLACIHKRI